MSGQPELERDRDLHYECVQFYHEEADLLDDQQLSEWGELLAEDVEYEMPRRVTRERDSELPTFVDEHYFRDNFESISRRIQKLQHPAAWAVNPMPRTRRFVTNVRVDEVDGDEIRARTNLLLFYGRGESPEHELLSMVREDTLRRTDEGLKLAHRRILLDHTVLPVGDIAMFF